MSLIIRKTEPAFYANIYMAGDIAQAKHICTGHCMTGLCVTVTETEFVYTGGRETGFVAGLVNYPKFPSTPDAILTEAETLANLLITGLHQHSALIQTPTEAVWLTRREDTSVSGTGEKTDV